MVSVDESGRLTQLLENPTQPVPIPGREHLAHVSMGVYVFPVDLLEQLLNEDARSADSQHDFGIDVLPKAIDRLRVMAYQLFAASAWMIDLIGATFAASMRSILPIWELVAVEPELNLYDQRWPIWTYQAQQPPAKFVLDEKRPHRFGDQLNRRRRLHHFRCLGVLLAVIQRRSGRGKHCYSPFGHHARRVNRPLLRHS